MEQDLTYLILSGANRFYFTGFASSFGCVLVKGSDKVFMTDARYESEARANVKDCEISLTTGSGFYSDIAIALKKLGAKTVGYEDDYLTVAEFDKIKQALSDFELVPLKGRIAEMRAIKTERELELIGEAEAITQRALGKVVSVLKVGMSEKEVSDLITYQFLLCGGDGEAFSNIVAFGANSAVPHHKPSARKLEKNDIVLIDIGAKYGGYCGDMTRTFCFGTPDEKFVKIHDIVLNAQQYALANIKAGMTCHEADALAREYIKANAYGDEFCHTLGHGVGIDVHEIPRVGQNSDYVLKENMVISVEPGIYIDGLGGVRIEDIVAVKADGVKNLTNFNKSITL